MKINPEAIAQIQVVEWIKNCTDLPVIHIAGERKCSPQYGALLKRMGSRSGCADLFIPRANGKYHGSFFELKTLKGKPTANQIKFLDEMNSEGYFSMVVYGADEAIETIKTFYSLPANDVPFNRV